VNTEDTSQLIECPVCFSKTTISADNYGDQLALASLNCLDCGFSSLVSNLEDEEVSDKLIKYYLRLLLDKIIQGEKARQIINNNPLFPYSRSDQLVALMENEVMPAINNPHNKSIKPLSVEDVATVKRILNL